MRETLQRILKTYKIKTFYRTTNTLRNSLDRIKDTIPFTSKQSSVDYDAFYVAESSYEITTYAKYNKSYTKGPPNNPVELENLQVRSAITMHTVLNNQQIDVENGGIAVVNKNTSEDNRMHST